MVAFVILKETAQLALSHFIHVGEGDKSVSVPLEQAVAFDQPERARAVLVNRREPIGGSPFDAGNSLAHALAPLTQDKVRPEPQ